MANDLDILATALYVKTDDLLKQAPHLAPLRPRVGIAPKLTDAELLGWRGFQHALAASGQARPHA